MCRSYFAVVVTVICYCPTIASAQVTVFAEVDGVQLVSIPQPSPGDGFLAATIQARTVDSRDTIVTFANLSIANVHHVWAGNGIQPPGGTAKGPPVSGPTYAVEWIPFDSHLLITSDMVGGGAAGGYVGITETNDGATDLPSLPPILGDVPSKTGLGDIAMRNPTAAFFVLPGFQRNSIDLAYLVTQDVPNQPPVELTLGLLGGLGGPGGTWKSSFGYTGGVLGEQIVQQPITVPIAPMENRTVSIGGQTQFTESFGDRILVGATVDELFLPITVAPAPDNDANYSVTLTNIRQISSDRTPISYNGSSRFSIPAGVTRDVGPFTLDTSAVGDWSTRFELSFNDGTVVDATLSTSVVPLPDGGTNGHDIGLVFAELGGVQLVAIPQPSPGGGFLATKIEARSIIPGESIVTLENIRISGAHHVWASDGTQPPGGTAKGRPTAGPDFHDNWISYDSHLLITEDMVGGGAGGSYTGIVETNDGSTTEALSLPPVLDGQVPALSGFGPIAMQDPSDAFFLKPEFQTETLDLAYVVTSGTSDMPVELVVGILGSEHLRAAFGYGENGAIPIPFLIPEPSTISLLMVIFVALSLYARYERQRT